MNIDFKIGRELKAIRQAKYMSQAQLCEGICSVSTLVRIEGERQAPSFELVVALTNRLGVSIDRLIHATNYSQNRFYYILKATIQTNLLTWRWSELDDYMRFVTGDLCERLPIVEQQFVDMIRIDLKYFFERDSRAACEMAQNSLDKTFNIKTKTFYSPEEMYLCNMLFRSRRNFASKKPIVNALMWLEQQPERMVDVDAWLGLIIGLTSYKCATSQWVEGLHYATKGYNIALKKNKSYHVIAFLFGQGLCLHQSNIDMAQGLHKMSTSLKFCLQFGMHEFYQILMREMTRYEIDLIAT